MARRNHIHSKRRGFVLKRKFLDISRKSGIWILTIFRNERVLATWCKNMFRKKLTYDWSWMEEFENEVNCIFMRSLFVKCRQFFIERANNFFISWRTFCEIIRDWSYRIWSNLVIFVWRTTTSREIFQKVFSAKGSVVFRWIEPSSIWREIIKKSRVKSAWNSPATSPSDS